MQKTDKSNLINTNLPRDSLVYADGDYVIKTPADTNPAHIKAWLERQKHAKYVVDSMREKQSTGDYFIPQIIEISEQGKNFVREERVSGKPLTQEYFAKLSPQQQNFIYHSFAQFIRDMNQVYPVLNIISQLGEYSVFLDSLKPVLTSKEISIINKTYELLEQHSQYTPSLVFFHGDMNENNIFFDEKTNTVSIIDFTEARYESAYYMFYSDLARLPWLDLNKLKEIYNKLQKKYPVIIRQDKDIMAVFNNLRTIQNTAKSLMAYPKNAEIYKRILKESVCAMEKAYDLYTNSFTLANMPLNSRA